MSSLSGVCVYPCPSLSSLCVYGASVMGADGEVVGFWLRWLVGFAGYSGVCGLTGLCDERSIVVAGFSLWLGNVPGAVENEECADSRLAGATTGKLCSRVVSKTMASETFLCDLTWNFLVSQELNCSR